MTVAQLEAATRDLALAGREIGNGIGAAAERAAAELGELDEVFNHSEYVQLGIAIGLIAAQDPAALAMLRTINEEWLRGA